MKSHRIIPIHEIVKIIEPKPVPFVRIVPFFIFAIHLRSLNRGHYVSNFVFLEEILKTAISIAFFVTLIGMELSSMICHNLANRFYPSIIINSFLKKHDAVF